MKKEKAHFRVLFSNDTTNITMIDLQKYIKAFNDSDSSIIKGIFINDVVHIGNITSFISNNRRYIGILIGNINYINKGYGTKVLNIFCHNIFTLYDDDIHIAVKSENIRAIKCYNKVGFVIHKQTHNGIIMVLTKKTFNDTH